MATNTVEIVLRGIDKASAVFADAGVSAERAMANASQAVDGLENQIVDVPDLDVSTKKTQGAVNDATKTVDTLDKTVSTVSDVDVDTKQAQGAVADATATVDRLDSTIGSVSDVAIDSTAAQGAINDATATVDKLDGNIKTVSDVVVDSTTAQAAVNNTTTAVDDLDREIGNVRGIIIDSNGVRTVSDVEAKVDDLGAKVRDVPDVELDTTKAEENADSLGESIADIAGKAAGTLGAAALFSEAWSQALDLQAGVDRMNATLAATPAQSQRFGDLAGKLYAEGYGEAVGDVTTSIDAVVSSIEEMSTASVGELDEVTQAAMNMSAAFDVDVSEAATAAGIMIKTGLADNALEAFDLMNAGMTQLPQGLRGEVFPVMEEYGKHFEAVGMTGEQAMALILHGADSGVIGMDKVGDAVKEFEVRVGNMNDTASNDALQSIGLDAEAMAAKMSAGGEQAEEAFSTIVQSLLNTEDPAKRAAAAVDIFGTPLEDLGMAKIPDFLNALSPTADALGNVEGASKRLGDEMNGGMLVALTAIGRSFIDTVKGAFEPFMEPATRVLDWARTTPGVMEGLAAAVGVLAAAVVGFTIAGIIPMITASLPVIGIVAGIAAAVAAAVMIFKNWGSITEWLGDIVSTAFTWINDTLLGFGIDLGAIWSGTIKPALDAMGALFSAIWGEVSRAITSAWTNSIQPVFQLLAGWFKDTLPVAIGVLQSIFGTAWSLISKAIGAAWSFMQPIFQTIQRVVSVVLGTAFMVLKDIVAVAWTGIQVAVQLAWAIISGIFNTIRSVVQKILAPVITWLWKNIVGPAFVGIGLVISRAWNTVIKPVFDFIRNVITRFLGPAFTWFYGSVIQPVWQRVSSAISGAWNNVIKPVFDKVTNVISKGLGPTFKWLYNSIVKPVFGWVGDKISGVWRSIIKPAFDAIKSGVKSVGTRFDDTVKNIGKAWDKIKSIAAKPIHFVLDRVINRGLIKGFNKLVDWIPGVKGLKNVGIPGWLKNYGFADGGYTGRGAKYTPAGVVHADEYVLNKEATRSLRRTVGLSGLDYMNQTGQFPGYATGGLVRPVNGTLTSRFGSRWGSFHSGIDYAVPTGTNVRAALAGQVERAKWNAVTGRTGLGMLLSHSGNRNTYYGHLSKTLAKVGETVRKGQTIAKSGNTGRSTGPHLHFETWTGGKPVNPLTYMGGLPSSAGGGVGGDGGGFDIFAPFKKIGESIKGWFTSKFPDGGIIVDAAVNAATGSFDKIAGWVKSKLPGAGDGGGNSAAKDAVRQVAERYGWDKGEQWSAIERIVQKESSWNMNAKNPTSSARGLFQKMTSIHGAIEKTAAGQAEWGLKYIKDRYHSPRTALDFHNRNNWYDNGGVLPSGLTLAMNATGGPEAILTRPQWSAMSALADYAAVHLAGLDASTSTGHGDEHAGVTRIENKYYFNVEIDASDLEDVADIKEFFEQLKRQAKEKRAHERGTKRSGKVNA